MLIPKHCEDLNTDEGELSKRQPAVNASTNVVLIWNSGA